MTGLQTVWGGVGEVRRRTKGEGGKMRGGSWIGVEGEKGRSWRRS